jgi:hypothetical protein
VHVDAGPMGSEMMEARGQMCISCCGDDVDDFMENIYHSWNSEQMLSSSTSRHHHYHLRI